MIILNNEFKYIYLVILNNIIPGKKLNHIRGGGDSILVFKDLNRVPS